MIENNAETWTKSDSAVSREKKTQRYTHEKQREQERARATVRAIAEMQRRAETERQGGR